MRSSLLASAVLIAASVLPCPGWAKKPSPPAPAVGTETSAPRPSPGTAMPLLPPTTAPITVESVFERLAEFDAKMTSLALSFRQSVRLEEGGAPQTKEGSLVFLKPKRLRLEYLRPEPQTVVSDGRTFWVWRKWINQVIESSFEDWRRNDPALEGLLNFGNYASLLKRYDVSVASVSARGADGHRSFRLDLRPKAKDAGFVLSLTLSTKDYFPYDARLTASGAVVESAFTDVRFNPDLSRSLFDFTPPKDADVFRYPNGP
ncbi:MAG: outer membrane lipoprotein carrier protein LolA [Elusimicrobia bacterium]|nr:outer membrane lipoprotein carrier protein LolA [Elusimicrobiota bacterium]